MLLDICPIDMRQPGTAERIRKLFYESYSVEAELIGSQDFAPLRRS